MAWSVRGCNVLCQSARRWCCAIIVREVCGGSRVLVVRPGGSLCRVDQLRQEILEEGTDTALKRLLTERIVTGWLMVRYFDAAIAQAVKGTRASHVRHLQQQLDKSQRRHTTAVKGLAELRKLLP